MAIHPQERPQPPDMSETQYSNTKSSQKSRWLWGIPAALIALFVVTLVQRLFFHPPMNFSHQVLVKAVPVKQETLAWTYQTTGTIEANNQVDLKPETAGKVIRIGFQEGQSVTRGQFLVRLEGDKQFAQLQQSAASVSAMQAGVSAKSVDIDRYQAEANAALSQQKLAETEFKRFEQLRKEELISIQELDQKRAALETTQANAQAAFKRIAMARADQRQAQADASAARSNYGYTRAMAADTLVSAPFTGLVGQKYIALGDYVAPGQKLLTLVDTSLLKVTFTVPERYLGFIHPNSTVTFSVESLPHKVFPASVIFIDPAVNLENRTVTVKAKVLADASLLKPGQFGDVKLALQSRPNTIVIPEEALVPQGEKFFVYKPKNHKAFLQEVQIGQREEGQVEIRSGLVFGDRIIVSGLQKLQEGADIMEAGEKPVQSGKGH